MKLGDYMYTHPEIFWMSYYYDNSEKKFTEEFFEEKDRLNQIEFIVKDGFDFWCSEARRPYFRMRGQKISEERVFDIVRRTDIKFSRENTPIDYTRCLFDSNWFADKPDYIVGWIHRDGTVGTNGITMKCPEISEILEGLVGLIHNFSDLEFVFAISKWDEMPDDMWEDMWSGRDSTKEFKEKHQLERYEDFEKNIDIMFYVHDYTIEVYEGQEAEEKYREYNNRFGCGNDDVYAYYYCDYYKLRPFTEDDYSKMVELNREKGLIEQ